MKRNFPCFNLTFITSVSLFSQLTEEEKSEETNQLREESNLLAVIGEVQLEEKHIATEEKGSYKEEVADEERKEEASHEEEEGGLPEEEEVKEDEEIEEEDEEEGEEKMMEEPLTSAAAAAPSADDEAIEMSSAQLEEDEVRGHPSQHRSPDTVAPSSVPANQVVVDLVEEASSWMCEKEREEDEKEAEKTGVTEEQVEEQLLPEEEGEVGTGEDEEKVEQVEPKGDVVTELSDVAVRPPSLTLQESNQELHSEVGGATSPSKTRTTRLHINLISPSLEKSGAFFQQSPTTVLPTESEKPVQTAADKDVEEEKPAEVEEEGAAGCGGVDEQQIRRPSQSKVRFTVAPAWQRSPSAEGEAKEILTPSGGVEEEVMEKDTATVQHDDNGEAEGGATVELEGSGEPLRLPHTETVPPVTAVTDGKLKKKSFSFYF